MGMRSGSHNRHFAISQKFCQFWKFLETLQNGSAEDEDLVLHHPRSIYTLGMGVGSLER